MVRIRRAPRQPVQNHPLGHLEGRGGGGVGDATAAEEMLDGQRPRVDIPVRAGTAHDGFLQKRLEEDLW